MIPPTKIVSIKIRIIEWRKSSGSINMFSYTVRVTSTRTYNRSMHGTSTNWTHILHRWDIRQFVSI